ncbi:MAG TPA: hypothetical protein VN814_13575 [Caulobacteraceae bacterium]|nr:hypothetical protein [Caulobacteraceae bacterium]
MDRRKFVVAGAGVMAVTATGAAASVLGENITLGGKRVTIAGWITPAGRGPGHYFVLGPDAGVTDPAVQRADQWPPQLTLVLPADARKIKPGKATLTGRLFRGKFIDGATGHAATAVLTEAALV